MDIQKKMERLEGRNTILNQKIQQMGRLRLILGLGIFFLLIASQIIKGLYLELGALFIGIPFFLVFFKISQRIKRALKEGTELFEFYNQQLSFQQGLFNQSVNPESMHSPSLARDLDLGFLLVKLDYCTSHEGRRLLDNWLCQNFSDSTILERMSQLKELCRFPGLLRKIQKSPPKNPIRFARIEAEVRRAFIPKLIWKWVIPLSWLSIPLLLIAGAPAITWKLAILVYVASHLFYMGLSKYVFTRLQDLEKDFSELTQRIRLYERLGQNLSFTPSLKQKLVTSDVKKLTGLISLMSLRSNPILFYILNILLPWDFFITEFSEHRRKEFVEHFTHWSAEFVQLEALGCLANLKFYHKTQWPEISGDHFVGVENLSHPLLNQESVVKNSFFPHDNRVIIITGSNMSGKSTFLRALGVNLCLANIGAPVFADRLIFQPMKIITCIRVSDSLRDGQSYFYAEVQRMKHILQAAKNEPVFFLIDEPLRGTNNRERLIGNQSYLQQILATQAKGFLSTHDLELTQLSKVSDQIANYHFSEQWVGENLAFDYKIKKGPSESTNALRILAQEGLYQPQTPQ